MARVFTAVIASLSLLLSTQQGVAASRALQQAPSPLPVSLTLPLLPPVAAETAQTPGPAGAATCALQYLMSAGTFGTLLDLVEASSEADLLTQILDSPDVQATLLAPSNAGIQAAASQLGISLPSLLANPSLITEILTYHLLPSTLQEGDLVNGNSFNTELSLGGMPRSVLVNGTGASATFAGGRSSAPISGSITRTCQITIVPLGGLLMP